jgi:Fe-S cluster assembly ATP-binding protein
VLSIKNLHASVEDSEILKGIDLEVGDGEVHAIMGPNGSGKSTLAGVLAGREGYTIGDGSVTFDGKDLLAMEPQERSCEGLFLAFQYPVEIPGVSNIYLLKSAVNAVRKYRGEEELDAMDLVSFIKEKMQLTGMDDSLLYRSVNEGFSGGEKKRNEMLQMAVLEPKLAILDETDSGLDIDALKIVADAVNRLRDANRSFILITHYQRLLDYIVPDQVHVLHNGQIAKSGDASLPSELEKTGYAWLTGANEAAEEAAQGQ